MNILLFNASPKNYGATQEILITIKDKIPPDFTVESLCLGDVNIQYCKGDKACYNTCECIHEDDMKSVIDKIDNSDIIMIAAPSYWADIPGQFKVFIDRCTLYSETNPNPHHRELIMGKKCYAIALRAGTRSAECEHIIDTIKHWCGHMKIDMVDSIYFTEINDKADIFMQREDIYLKIKDWLN